MAQGAAHVRLGADERRDEEEREGQQDWRSHDAAAKMAFDIPVEPFDRNTLELALFFQADASLLHQ